MSSSLSQWLRRKVDRDSNATPPLPSLPAQRARRLSTSSDDNATSASAFFQTLPPEIRRKILIAAFGSRTVHLDLRLAHPIRDPKPQKKPIYRRVGGNSSSSNGKNGSSQQQAPGDQRPRHANTHPPDARDTSKPRQWEWHSSVCHRPLPFIDEFDEYPAWDDICHSGLASWRVDCTLWPGEAPDKCLLGVMGWLQTCRAAYVEGVEVLYGTNRIHIQGTYLCRHLPEVVPSQRLATVAKVELVWVLRLWGAQETIHNLAEDHPPDGGLERYEALAAALPGVFPGLRSLHLAITGAPIGYKKPEEVDLLELLLKPLDEMVRSMATLREFRVSVPQSLYKHFHNHSVYKLGPPSPHYAWKSWWEAYRILRPPPEDSSDLSAYVVSSGQADVPIIWGCNNSL